MAENRSPSFKIWNFFSKPGKLENPLSLQCNICGLEAKHNKKTTTNLQSHVNKNHKDLWIKALETNEDISVDDNQSSYQTKLTSIMPTRFTNEQFEELLLKWIISDSQSFATVANPHLQRLLNFVHQRPLQLMSADTVSRRIQNLYSVMRSKIVDAIQSNQSKFSFSTDMWTSPAGVSFMAITLHFIDDKWNIKSILLDFVSFSGSHSGINLANKFSEIVDSFVQDKSKILAICTDNASNNDTFVDQLIKREYLSSPEGHIRCFAHILHLAAQDALNEIVTSICYLREAIKFVRSSNISMETLRKVCLEQNIAFVKPILDVPIRWNSTYAMLLTATKLSGKVKVILNK